MALNNTEHVRIYLAGLPRELDWRGVEQAMEESCGAEGKEQVNKALNGQLYNADLDLQREIKRIITLLTDKVGETGVWGDWETGVRGYNPFFGEHHEPVSLTHLFQIYVWTIRVAQLYFLPYC